MRVLFDTNVVLDVLWARAPHAEAATALLDHVARKELDALLCATSITTIFYLAEKASGRAPARRHVGDLLDLFDIAPVSRSVLNDALALRFNDYEDAVLHEAARHSGATAVVTRNIKDFSGSRLALYQPVELLKLLRAAG
jgi:predicted nucleic acid-binding protein